MIETWPEIVVHEEAPGWTDMPSFPHPSWWLWRAPWSGTLASLPWEGGRHCPPSLPLKDWCVGFAKQETEFDNFPQKRLEDAMQGAASPAVSHGARGTDNNDIQSQWHDGVSSSIDLLLPDSKCSQEEGDDADAAKQMITQKLSPQSSSRPLVRWDKIVLVYYEVN